MAVIKLSALVADIRGKVHQSIFMGGISGNVVRINGARKITGGSIFAFNHPAAGSQRAIITDVSQTWNSLTTAQQQSWKSQAGLINRKNKVGSKKYVTGMGLFVWYNSNLRYLNQSIIVNPPLIFPTITWADVNFSLNHGGNLSVTLNSITPAGWWLIVRAGPSVSNSVNPNSINFVRIFSLASGSMGSIVITSYYVAQFGTPVVGKYVTLQFYLMNQTTGQTTTPFYSKLISS